MKLLAFEVNTLVHVANAPAPKGSSIRDIRLTENILSKLKESLPALPTKPDDESEELMKQYAQQVQEWPNMECDVDFNDFNLHIIRAKFSVFPNFSSEPENRIKMINLAEKLGV